MSANAAAVAERQLLRETVRSFLERYSSEAEIRRVMETPQAFDRALWGRMADELGLQGMGVPEAFGGGGYGFPELQIVLEELGRSLACVPFLSSAVLASNVLLASGDADSSHRYLPGLCSGASVAAVAITGADVGHDGDNGRFAAALDGDRHLLTGERRFVSDAQTADLLLVIADTAAGPTIFVVDTHAPGVSVAAMESLDATRRLAEVDLKAAEGRLLGSPGAATEIIRQALIPAAAALASEQVGGARRTLELAVEYANVRKQFGQLIGSFQAIKQKCAEMLLAVESATSAAHAAGLAIDQASSDGALLAFLALAECSEAFVFVATEAIEIFGGIGFTWEHPAHLYYKRALASSVLFGSATANRERLLIELGH
jgi:alkylation response protein AidB-like acyl-CoA dehydrogenase